MPALIQKPDAVSNFTGSARFLADTYPLDVIAQGDLVTGRALSPAGTYRLRPAGRLGAHVGNAPRGSVAARPAVYDDRSGSGDPQVCIVRATRSVARAAQFSCHGCTDGGTVARATRRADRVKHANHVSYARRADRPGLAMTRLMTSRAGGDTTQAGCPAGKYPA